MGRAPCCEKIGLKKGPWSPEEDQILISYIQKYGHENWRALPKQAGLLRCGKSCRLRWINYLRPDIKRGNFTDEEEETIIKLHEMLGNRWSAIAARLQGRTDNEIKNVWHTHLKKKLNKNEHIISKKHRSETKKDSSSKRRPTCGIATAKVTDQLEAATSSMSPQPCSSDFSSVTETTSFGAKEANNNEENVGIVKEENNMECRFSESTSSFPEIDENFWSEAALSVENSNVASDLSEFSYAYSPSSINSVDFGYDYGMINMNIDYDMNFWYDIFLNAGGSPETPEF